MRVQLLEQRDERGAVRAVEIPGGLVGEEDRRRADERARDGSALELSTRELVRAVLGTRAHAEAFEHRASSADALGRRHAGEREW